MTQIIVPNDPIDESCGDASYVTDSANNAFKATGNLIVIAIEPTAPMDLSACEPTGYFGDDEITDVPNKVEILHHTHP